ncbi:hypothetical protein [Loktanella sp. SALINAS62]|uniref:hypothetical protein n=1 Tax=Loktanella sp. SALINAS62 TaxID=2706124 RepID=UPI0020124344|nr:hypothetical protein [Loktanella sp. SALINAS62]
MNAVLRLSLPLTVWLASFSAVYGLHGLLCSDRGSMLLGNGMGRALLILATVAAIVVQAVLLAALRSRRWRDPDPTLQRISLGLAIVAFVSTVWTLLPPVVATQTCDRNPQAQLDPSDRRLREDPHQAKKSAWPIPAGVVA